MADPRPELPLDPDAPPRPLHARPLLWLVVLAGGVLGTAVRSLVATGLPHPRDGIPVATLAVNLAGSFVLGVLLEALARGGPDTGWRQTARLAAGTGFCGGLTTYSTFAVEVSRLLRDGAGGRAAAYAAATLAGCLAAAALGIAAGRLR